MEKEPLSFGLPKVEPMSMVDVLSTSVMVSQDNMVKAELAPPSSMAALGFAQKEAVARGYLSYFTKNLNPADPATSDVLKIVGGAIRSQDFGTLQKIAPDLASVLSIYSGNPAAFDKYNNFAKEVLQGQITIAESTSQLAKAEADAASARTVHGIVSNTPNISDNIYRASFSLQGLGSYVKDISSEISSLRSQAAIEDDEDIKTAMLDRANVVEDSLIKGSVANALRDLTSEEVGQLRSSLATGNAEYIDGLPASVRANFFVIEQSFSSADQRAKIDNLMAEYASGPAKFIEDKARREAEMEADQSVNDQLPRLLSAVSNAEVNDGVNVLLGNLSSITGLSDGDRKTIEKSVYTEAGRASLNLAMRQAQTEDQVLAISTYVRTGVNNGLSPQVIESLDLLRGYAARIDDKGFLDSVVNTYSLQRQREIEAVNKARNERIQMNLASTGQANPRIEEGRVAASNIILSDINSVLTRDGSQGVQQVPTDFFTNPAYANNEQFFQPFTRMYNTQGLMPTELLTALQSVANGNLTTSNRFNYNTVLAHYEKMRLIETPTGSIQNPAINALTIYEKGILDTIIAAKVIIPEDQIPIIFSAASQQLIDPNFSDRANRFLGETSLDDWLSTSINSFSLLSPDQRESIKALANLTIAQSFASPAMATSPSGLKTALNRQMDEFFPDGGGKVVQIDTNGMPSRRTQYALSKTVGSYEDDFVSYVLSDVQKLAGEGFTARNFYSEIVSSTPKFFAPTLYTMGREAIVNSLRGDKYLELVPSGPDSLGGISYYVHEFDPRTGIRKMIQRNDGQGPIIVSTKERGFTSIVDGKVAAENAKQLRRAEFDKLIYETELNQIPVMP